MTFELPFDIVKSTTAILLNLYTELVTSKNVIDLMLISCFCVLLFEKVSEVAVLRIYVCTPTLLVKSAILFDLLSNRALTSREQIVSVLRPIERIKLISSVSFFQVDLIDNLLCFRRILSLIIYLNRYEVMKLLELPPFEHRSDFERLLGLLVFLKFADFCYQ